MSNKKIIAIIPARAGSKGIPGKNLIQLSGKPLVAYTIEAALKSKSISKTYVTSENSQILNISAKYGASIIVRPRDLASDNTSMEEVVLDALRQIEKKGELYDLLILLQPTSPLRDENDIEKAIKLFHARKVTGLISGYKPIRSPFKAFKVNEKGYLEGLIDSRSPFDNRQNLPESFMANGAIYIISISEFKKNKSLLSNRTIPFIMGGQKSIDIDHKEDLKLFEAFISTRKC